MLANPENRARVTAFGSDPAKLRTLYIEALNQTVAERPADMTAALHICRGNFKGKWLTEGGYDDIAEAVFQGVDVDGFFLEFDTQRAGGFEALRHVPSGKKVVLGLVSSKIGQIEDPIVIRKRVEEAARYLPIESLSISPQCGFASTVAGNPITEQHQIDKLAALVQLAEEIWGAG
jgi:5-methyltetrahydropteroyltriglutamate--homocysteine methyltransferase